jgi:uncharacterized membrane protein YgcG
MKLFRSSRTFLVAVTLALAPVIAMHRATAACPRTAVAYTRMAQKAAADSDCLDLFFHPLGLSTSLGVFVWTGDPPGYPSSGNGNNSGGGDPGGGDPSGGDPSGGDPGGGDPSGAPEPATLLSAVVGAGLLGVFGWRRRFR